MTNICFVASFHSWVLAKYALTASGVRSMCFASFLSKVIKIKKNKKDRESILGLFLSQ